MVDETRAGGRLPRQWRRPLGGTGTRRVPRLRGDDALAALNASADAILGVADDGTCVTANLAALGLFGHAPRELDGLGVHLLVPELGQAVRALLARRAAGSRTVGPGTDGADGVELHGVRRSGETFPARVWLTPTFAGRRLVVLATVRDLSAERAAAAATRALLDDVHELRAVVGAVTAAITERAVMVTDAQGHLTTFNRAAEKLLGHRAEDVVGRPLAVLSDADDLDAVRAELKLTPDVDPLLELTRSGLPNHQRWSLLTRTGERRAVDLRITAIGDREDPLGFVAVAGERQWEPLTAPKPSSDRLLLDLDDAETRALRWQVGGSVARRR